MKAVNCLLRKTRADPPSVSVVCFCHFPLKMLDDSSIANDLESLKIAARKARENQNELYFSKQKANRTDIVHAGYRFFQSVSDQIRLSTFFRLVYEKRKAVAVIFHIV